MTFFPARLARSLSLLCADPISGNAGTGRPQGRYRQILTAHVGARRWRAALFVAGVDGPQRLWHAERHLPSAIDDAALLLAQILQFADAARDLLLSRLRHSRHDRHLPPRRPGLAWLCPLASCARVGPVRAGPARGFAQHDDPYFQLKRFRAKWGPVRVKKTRQNKSLLQKS